MNSEDGTDPLLAGEYLLQAGRYLEALSAFESLLNEEPENVDALVNLGTAAICAGNIQRGLDAHLHALTLDPINPIVVENLAALVKKPAVAKYVGHFLDQIFRRETIDPQSRHCAAVLGQMLEVGGSYRAARLACTFTPGESQRRASSLQTNGRDQASTRSDLNKSKLQILLIEDDPGNRALIISADLSGFNAFPVAHIQSSARQWGIPPEAVIINTSPPAGAFRTVRGAPKLCGTADEIASGQIVQMIAQAIQVLHENLQPCFVYSAECRARIDTWTAQRVGNSIPTGVREGADGAYYHERTPILIIDFLGDGSSLLLVSHGRGFVGPAATSSNSADYPKYLREYLKNAHIADDVFFLQGPAVGVGRRVDDSAGSASPTNWIEAVEIGRQMAISVAQSVERPLKCVRGPIFARLDPVVLPQQPEEMDVQLFTFGDKACFVTFPGRLAAELANDVLATGTLPSGTFVLGHTNERIGSLPRKQLTRDAGNHPNETESAHGSVVSSARDAERSILDAVSTQVSCWHETDRPNGYGRYHLAREKGDAFFCLSTGRCGTQTLTYLLGTATNARVYHHPRPYLIDETLSAYHSEIHKSDVFWRARGGVVRDAWKDGLVFGELDHNMTPFVPTIASDIERSRFIVLVRNPWGFVRSGMRRGYYSSHAWDSGRLRPEADHPDAGRWERMVPFEKICWLWNDTYRRIRETLCELAADRFLIVRFEDLVGKANHSKVVFNFLGLEGHNDEKIQLVLSRRLNAQTTGDFPAPGEWSASLHETLRRECREMIDFFGYQGHLSGQSVDLTAGSK